MISLIAYAFLLFAYVLMTFTNWMLVRKVAKLKQKNEELEASVLALKRYLEKLSNE